MNLRDLFGFAAEALRSHRLRTGLTAAAVAIGVGSVLLLVSLGEGAREWVLQRLQTLGSNLLVVIPGKTSTHGGPPLVPGSVRDLTLEDCAAIERQLPGVLHVIPVTLGEATVTYGRVGRTCPLVGSTQDFLTIRGVKLATGTDLPNRDPREKGRVCIIGRTVQKELFRDENPLGKRIRVAEADFQVIGTVLPFGESIHINVDEMVLLPVATAMQLMNLRGLFRIIVQGSAVTDLKVLEDRLRALLKERHDGEEDFTILTPGALAAAALTIIDMITAALSAIAAVSLVVAGVGVMNVMLVSVTERTSEVGLLKALGASNGQVLRLFLSEALVLSLTGGAIGVAAGMALTNLAWRLYPTIPFTTPLWAVEMSFGVAALVGIAFGILPAIRASRLPPLESLRKKV